MHSSVSCQVKCLSLRQSDGRLSHHTAVLGVHHIARSTDRAWLGPRPRAVTPAWLVAGGAEQFALVPEALVVTVTALVTHLPAVLRVALTPAVPLPGASSLAFPIAAAELSVEAQARAGPALWPVVICSAANLESVHTEPLPEGRSGVRVQSPPGLYIVLPLPVVLVALSLPPSDLLADLLCYLHQPHLARKISLARLLLPGRVSPLQFSSLSSLHPGLETGDEVCAGATRRQLRESSNFTPVIRVVANQRDGIK